jgi:hypothetical protein
MAKELSFHHGAYGALFPVHAKAEFLFEELVDTGHRALSRPGQLHINITMSA